MPGERKGKEDRGRLGGWFDGRMGRETEARLLMKMDRGTTETCRHAEMNRLTEREGKKMALKLSRDSVNVFTVNREQMEKHSRLTLTSVYIS